MPRDAPSVSVIVRSMARESLAASLLSIARQKDVSAEVIVVAACGASHPPLPSSCGSHDLQTVTSERRLSRPAAANAGLDAAQGSWITFLDDDDVMLDDHLAGLVAATSQAPAAGVVTSLAKCVFRDGHVEWFGQPFSHKQLHERNFIHLSATLFAHELVSERCRFDESLEIHEDWEFMLQLAEHAAFHFVPLATFQWNADAGDSGAAAGANHDMARFAAIRDRVYEKHRASYEVLNARTQPLLVRATTLLSSRRLTDADAACREVLAISTNDPWALNLRAMILQQAGRLTEAHAMQALAVAVRPQDAGFVYNLALFDQMAGEIDAARRNARRSYSLDATFEPAHTLLAELGAPDP